MTGAVHHQRGRRGKLGSAGEGDWAGTRPLGMSVIGLVILITAAWGGVVGFIGPLFGYRPTSSGSWQWTTVNWLLHLVPGAVGVVAGLAILGSSPRHRAVTRGTFGLAGLLAVAAGAWFVIGPALWPVFESGQPYGPASSADTSFVHQLGANLGPGLLLAIFGGMALKSLTRDRPVTRRAGAGREPAPRDAAATQSAGTTPTAVAGSVDPARTAMPMSAQAEGADRTMQAEYPAGGEFRREGEHSPQGAYRQVGADTGGERLSERPVASPGASEGPLGGGDLTTEQAREEL